MTSLSSADKLSPMEWIIPRDCPVSPLTYILVAIAAFLMTSVSKGGFGGVGILAVPMMLMVAPGKFVLGMWLPLLVLCDICTIRAYPREWELRPILLLSPWMFAGILVGYVLLDVLTAGDVKLFVGALALAFVILEVARESLARWLRQHQERPPWRPTLWTTAPFGLVGGVSTMIAHSAGAVTTIYLLAQRMEKRAFVGTSGRYYFLFNSLKVPFYVKLGMINGLTLRQSLWMVPLAPLGVWIGSALNRRFPPQAFNRFVYVLLAVTAAYLLWESLAGGNGK